MNLSKLFEMQWELDGHIERKHPRKPKEDRLAKKILALLVELGELANEWRGFKFWSYDQKPRTKVHKTYTSVLGIEKNYSNPLLEEYVDALHFILSIGLEITEPDTLDLKRWNLTKADNITEQFLWVMDDVTDLYNGLYHDGNFKFDYEYLLLQFIHLGEMLGFSWQEIEQAYMSKNAENHARQKNGY